MLQYTINSDANTTQLALVDLNLKPFNMSFINSYFHDGLAGALLSLRKLNVCPAAAGKCGVRLRLRSSFCQAISVVALLLSLAGSLAQSAPPGVSLTCAAGGI